MSFFDSLLVALFCFMMVLVVLFFLFLFIRLFSHVFVWISRGSLLSSNGKEK